MSATTPRGATRRAQHHLEWTPSRLTDWAGRIGPETRALVAAILAERPHPEQGYRSCLGLMRLGRRSGAARLEAACGRALAVGACSYRHVDSILKHGLDRAPVPEAAAASRPLPVHEHLRGREYYQEPAAPAAPTGDVSGPGLQDR